MIQSPKSYSSYQVDLLTSLAQTGITQTNPGGKARAFSDIIANELSILDANNYTAIGQSLLPYATDDNLDYIGQIFGVPRLQRQDPSSDISESNFEFYVRTGTFGGINNGQDITIPAGTQITTASITGPVYVTTTVVVLSSGDSSAYFSATSLSTGTSGNSGSTTFTKTNFSNYADSFYGTLLVTNNYGVIDGSDEEDDDSYRYRINLKLQSENGAAEIDLRLAILTVPGIQDVVFERLSGTFNVYAYGISPVISPTLIQTVQTLINQKVAYPLVGTVIAPDLIGISLETSITFASGVQQSDESTVITNATTAASNYINNLGIGGTLVINALASVIIGSDSRILDIGDPDKPITAIYIWRSKADGTRYSRSLIADYTAQTGERIVVESIDSPINLTVN